jgi:hypothetical protein
VDILFQYLGLILVLVTWLAGYYLVMKWRDKNSHTISRHAASTKHASLLFAAVLISCGFLFYIWLLKWFIPHLGLGLAFLIALTMAMLGQLVTALAPDIEGLRRTIHHYAAYTMAILFMPLTALIFMAPHTSTLARILVGCHPPVIMDTLSLSR